MLLRSLGHNGESKIKSHIKQIIRVTYGTSNVVDLERPSLDVLAANDQHLQLY